MKIIYIILLSISFITLTACSPNSENSEGGTANAQTVNYASSFGVSMEQRDYEKFSKALDNPIGKSANWSNSLTGTQYTVTPIKKIAVGNNNFCRNYSIAIRQGKRNQQVTGNACVDPNSGLWRPVANS